MIYRCYPTLESPTKKTVEEMKKLRIKEDQESTEVQGITTRSNICSTEITEDVEEQEGEKSDHAATAAVPFPCDLDGDTEGNPYKQSKMVQRAGIPSIVAGDDTLILKKDDMPGTGSRHAGNGSDDGLTMPWWLNRRLLRWFKRKRGHLRVMEFE